MLRKAWKLFKEQKLVVIGSKNMVSYDDVNKELLLYDQRVEIKALTHDARHQEVVFDLLDHHIHHNHDRRQTVSSRTHGLGTISCGRCSTAGAHDCNHSGAAAAHTRDEGC